MTEIFLNTHNYENRSKKFVLYDSLRFEKERLETFVDWTVLWLKPADLACNGFYFLRTMDHCACAFCHGIVGDWKKEDTVWGEHQHHFPRCPFMRGHPVGNIPLKHGRIISRLSLRPEAGSTEMIIFGAGQHTSRSRSEKNDPSNKTHTNLEGVVGHNGPKRCDYLTYESLLDSYVRWPELIKQKPKDLSKAGFSYCGLRDHVRCFHCGNGLRNWETNDIPWREHARWYPECNCVLHTKGQKYINQACHEGYPYTRSQPSTPVLTSTPTFVGLKITNQEIKSLMKLDIIQGALAMGFPEQKVRSILKCKLEKTWMPLFSLELCIESILQFMEEETFQTLHQRSRKEIEEEATKDQAIKASQPGAGYVIESIGVMNWVNEVIGMVDCTLKQPFSSPSPSLKHIEINEEAVSILMSNDKSFNDIKVVGAMPVPKFTQFTEELKNSERLACKICTDDELGVLFLPGPHMVTCTSCALTVAQCPICRKNIKYTVKPILS